jgi:hypothetical protein
MPTKPAGNRKSHRPCPTNRTDLYQLRVYPMLAVVYQGTVTILL